MNKSAYLFFLLFFLSFCGINKTTRSPSDLSISTAEVIEKINHKKNHSKWLSLRGRVNIIHNNKTISFNINIKNRRDSIIWVSASGPLGIEIIRAQLTPTSIYFMNRINKTFFIQPASEVKNLLNFDLSFFDVQDILFAKPKRLNNRYNLQLTKTGYCLFSDSLSYTISSNYTVEKVEIAQEKYNLELSYEQYHKTDDYPRKITLTAETEDTLEVNVNYSKVQFNKSEKILFNVPDSYEEIK